LLAEKTFAVGSFVSILRLTILKLFLPQTLSSLKVVTDCFLIMRRLLLACRQTLRGFLTHSRVCYGLPCFSREKP